jgi:hypothetical protein
MHIFNTELVDQNGFWFSVQIKCLLVEEPVFFLKF